MDRMTVSYVATFNEEITSLEGATHFLSGGSLTNVTHYLICMRNRDHTLGQEVVFVFVRNATQYDRRVSNGAAQNRFSNVLGVGRAAHSSSCH